MLRGNKFLVIGGAGFIGSHVVERLLGAGASVRVLDNLSSGGIRNLAGVIDDVELVEGSMLDQTALDRAIHGVRGVFHLAAVVSVPRSIEEPLEVHEMNATGTLRVLEAARWADAKVVFSSSAAVYGDSREHPKREGGPTGPVSPYGVQKLNGEDYLRCYHALHGLEGFALRYFNVYGPRQDARSPYSGVITMFAQRALRGEPLTIFGDGSNTRDFVYVEDVAEANLLAMAAPGGEGTAVNIGTGRSVSLLQLANETIAVAGSRSPIKFMTARPGDIRHSCSDAELAAERLDFRASTPLPVGLRRAVEFFASEMNEDRSRIAA